MVAVVPQPPLMVPQLTAGRAAESEPMRAACLDVAARLAGAADQWLVVASDPGGRRTMDHPAGGTFRGYGVDVRVTLGPDVPAAPGADPGTPTGPAGALGGRSRGGSGRAQMYPDGYIDEYLPLPLLIAGWLRGQVAPGVRVAAELVPPDLPTEACRRLGAQLAARPTPAPVALLVVGDGATTHGEKSPGYLDRRAEPFDAAVAAALADADPAGLLALDAGLAGELNAAGRAPWQVLAGASEGGRWHGELAYSAAPFGVAYHVALWRRQP
jgi:hypothetical protein